MMNVSYFIVVTELLISEFVHKEIKLDFSYLNFRRGALISLRRMGVILFSWKKRDGAVSVHATLGTEMFLQVL